jgi:type VI secretion system protein ImpL
MLTNRLLWLIIGFLTFALIIWFAGPFLSFAQYQPLDSPSARLTFIAIIFGLWVLRRIWRSWRARDKNRNFFANLQPKLDPKIEQNPIIKERFAKATGLLRDAKVGGSGSKLARIAGLGGNKYIYELPWYMFIGAPGSGKTTALLNSGLKFTLSEKLGAEPIQGVGGTRHCDWMFADEAVLVDTAGRYTMQDSDQANDSKEWGDFLALLKKYRPRQPINGVLVTVSVADLLQTTIQERARQANSVRARLQELMSALGNKFAVYVLVTKADLLAGFSESFGDLDREQRNQVLGLTFDLTPQTENIFDPAIFRKEMDALVARLQVNSIDALKKERDPLRRARVYGFPSQLGSIASTLEAFLADAFGPSKITGTPAIRGVYFTSGTQEGSPIDRVLGALSRSLGFQGRVVPAQVPTGKAFFLANLLQKVIFAESAYAGTNLQWEARTKKIKIAVSLLAGLIGITYVSGASYSYLNNKNYISTVEAKAKTLSEIVKQGNSTGRSVSELIAVLKQARTIAETDLVSVAKPKWDYRFGLSQADKLDGAGRQIYNRMLQDSLAPYLAIRLESSLGRGASNPELLYEALKTYIMLQNTEKMRPDQIAAWVAIDAETDVQIGLTPEERIELAEHTTALLARGGFQTAIVFNQQLVNDTRALLLRDSFPQRVYSRIKLDTLNGDLPDFRIASAGGQSAAIVFVRPSGQPLTKGIGSLFTYDGYYKVFNKALDDGIRELAEEEIWVLGVRDSENAKRALNPTTRLQLGDEVRKLYLQEYGNTWEKYVADIAIIRSTNITQSISTAQILASPDSPLVRLMTAIVRETTLTERPDAVKQATDRASQIAKEATEKMRRLIGPNPNSMAISTTQGKVEALVDDRFEALRRFVKPLTPGTPPQINQTMLLFNDLAMHLQSTDRALKSGQTPPPSTALDKLTSELQRMPEPVKGMLASLTSSGEKQALGGAKAAAGKQMGASVGGACTKALAGRYPFVSGSNKDVLAQDFANLFGPGGQIEDFFNKNLAPLVDTGALPWRFRKTGDGSGGELSAALVQFQRAAEIKQVFFASGTKQASYRIEIRPVEIDRSIGTLEIDVDGQVVRFNNASAPPQSIQWPGPKGSNQVRLVATPVAPLPPPVTPNPTPTTADKATTTDKTATTPASSAASTAPPTAPTTGAVNPNPAESPNRTSATLASANATVFDGVWALQRMLDSGRVEQIGGPEKLRLTLSVDGKKVVLQLTSASVQNPLRLPELLSFKCPNQL